MNGNSFKTDQVCWQRPGHSRSRAAVLLVVLTALIAVVATAAVLVGVRSDDAGERPAGEVETGGGADPGLMPDSAQSPVSSTSTGTTSGAGAGLVELPVGGDSIDGHPVGFSHDELGAAAVPVELNRSQVGFDYASAVDVARLYAAPGDAAALAGRARAAVESRRRTLGVADRGAVAAPASFALSPYAYALTAMPANTSAGDGPSGTGSTDGTEEAVGSGRSDGAERYVVSVLSLASLTDSAGRVSQRYYGGTQLVMWSEEDDDWKVLEPGRGEVDQLRRLERSGSTPEVSVAPGQVRALREAGWTPIATGVNEQAMNR